MNQFASDMKKKDLCSYAEGFIEDKVAESKQFLDMFSKGLSRPKFDIVRGLRNYMSNVMRNIYEIHNDLIFSTEVISIDELFSSYLPIEYKKFLEKSINSLPVKDHTKDPENDLNLEILETECKNLQEKLQAEY